MEQRQKEADCFLQFEPDYENRTREESSDDESSSYLEDEDSIVVTLKRRLEDSKSSLLLDDTADLTEALEQQLMELSCRDLIWPNDDQY